MDRSIQDAVESNVSTGKVNAIKDSMHDQFDLETSGKSIIFHTPFVFRDGDEFRIVLKVENGSLVFSDEGHASYHVGEAHLIAIIDGLRKMFGIDLDDGVLYLNVDGEGEVGSKLFDFIQATMHVVATSS